MAKVTLKDSKENIFKAYQEAIKESQRLAKEVDSLNDEIADLESSLEDGDYSAPAASVDADTTNADGIISSLTGVQQGISQAISTLSAQQVIEAEQIQKITQQIEEEKQEAKTLYDIDLNGNTLEELIVSYDQEKTSFEETFSTKKKAFGEETTNKTTAWQKEQDEYNRRVAERNKEALVSRKREQDEFDYALKQTRALEEDTYAQKRKQLDDELAVIRADKDKSWAEKEKAIAEREQQFAEYKRKYEGLEAELQKEVKKAEAEGKAIIERDHKVKLALYQSEVDANQKSLDLRIGSLQQVIKNQEEQLKKLTAQLDNALLQAQSLALKALEGSSNAESFAAIREIAIEQAKNSNKSK